MVTRSALSFQNERLIAGESRCDDTGFLFGYNPFMRRYAKFTVLFSILFTGLLISTLIQPVKERVDIPFSMPAGQKGIVHLSIPVQVFAGDRVHLSAKVAFSDEMEMLENTHITGRLEAGFEEIQPAGETRINLSFTSPVEFNWWVRSAREATYQGTLWLWLEVEGSRELLLAREFVLGSHNYLGWRVQSLRVLFACLAGVLIFLVAVDFLRNFQR